MKKGIIFYAPILLILFQSCVAYQKTSVSLDQAYNRGKVKLIGESGQVYKFTNIELRDSVYYGLGREYISQTEYITRPDSKTLIDSTIVSSIFIKDKRKSSTRTVLLVLAGLPVVFIIIPVIIYSVSVTVN